MTPVKILLVDDEWLIRDELRMMLEQIGKAFIISEAATLKAAIFQIEQVRPNLIFLDLHLPDGSGVDLLALIDNDCKVIVITAFDPCTFNLTAESILACLMKPINREKLKMVMNHFIAGEGASV